MQKLAAILAILLFCLLEASGQLPDYHVDLINTRSGINLAGAREVIQDKKGFLWILSENNLQRYDGSTVKIFDPAPLLKNVFCDDAGTIWLVSQRAVYRFINDHSGFEEIAVDSLSNYLFAIHQLPDRSYWVSHTKGLMKYDTSKKRFENVPLPFLRETRIKGGVPSRVIKAVEQRGNLFCLLQIDTAYVFNSITGKIQSRVFPRLNFSIFTNDDKILLAGFDAYSFEWDLVTNAIKKVTFNPGNKAGENFFYARQSLQLGKNNHYLLSNRGLLQVTNDSMRKIRLFLDGMPLQGEEVIRYMSRGRDGKIFMLHEDAVLFFDPKPRRVQTIKNFTTDLSKKPGTRPNECIIDDKQNLWIASFNGFSRWNLLTNEYKNYKAHGGMQKDVLNHPVVWHIAWDGKNILITPDQQGLLLFDPVTEQFKRPAFATDSVGKKMESQINKTTAFFLRRLRNGNFLFANRHGVFMMETDHYTIKQLKLPKTPIFYMSAVETAGGYIWFGTMRGIVGIDSNLVMKRHIEMPGKDKEIIVLCENGPNELLAGNKSIYQITNPLDSNPVIKTFLPYFEGKTVAQLYRDAPGNVWIGTSDAMYRYNAASNNLQRVTNPDFVVRQHQLNGLFESKNGTIFFCSENGVNYFDPANIFPSEEKPEIYFTNVTINNDDSSFLLNGSIPASLPYSQNSLVFDFVSPFLGPGNVQYRYRLQGFDKHWISSGTNHQVRYAALSPGAYKFEVSASLDGINWFDSKNRLAISISEPFWRTSWFMGICFIVLGLAGYAVYRYRHNRRHEKEVKQMIDYFANSGYEHSSVEDIVWDIARNCISRLNFEDCVIYLLDEDRGVLVQKAAYGPKSPKAFEIMNPIDIPLGKGIVGNVALSGKAEIVHDTSADNRYIVDDKARASEITVPIIHEGNVIGIIDSEHRRKRFFNKTHVQVLQTIANLCSAKISRAMALDAMRKSKLQLMELNMKMAESKFLNLRLQMNPHFLFNSLSSIQHLVVSQQTSRAYKYLTVFSNLLRSLLQYAESNFISLDREMAMLKMYLDLETLRFDESFHYTIDVDESLEQEEVLLPSLMVQPFAENAIWHGLMHKEGDKKLHIFFSNYQDDYLTCIIDDNGIGRKSAAAIRKKNISSMVHESKGIRIIEERLSLLQQKTGKPARVEIVDKTDELGRPMGTRVVITIPFYNKEEV